MTTHTAEETEGLVMPYVDTMLKWFEADPSRRHVVYVDCDRPQESGFTAKFAERFGCPAGSEEKVHEALMLLKQMRLVYVERVLISPERHGDRKGKRKPYPAQYRVTVDYR